MIDNTGALPTLTYVICYKCGMYYNDFHLCSMGAGGNSPSRFSIHEGNSTTTRDLVTAQFEKVAAELATLRDLVYADLLEGEHVERVIFDSPVGTAAERAGAKLWPGAWYDATGYAKRYEIKPGVWHYHTGADLNLPGYADVKAPVYAAADGEVVFVGVGTGTWGKLVVIKHTLEDGSQVWSRHAHLGDWQVAMKQRIKRGEQIGIVGDFAPVGPPGDHHHFDIAKIDLGAKPSDWPGADLQRVIRDYHPPLEFIEARHG